MSGVKAVEPPDSPKSPPEESPDSKQLALPDQSPQESTSTPQNGSGPSPQEYDSTRSRPKYSSASQGFSDMQHLQPGAPDDDEFLATEENENTRRLIKASLSGQDAVAKSDLAAYLEWDIENLNACVKFPLTFCYFVFFATALLSHEDIANSALMQRGITNMITGSSFEGGHYDSGHKFMSDIAAKEDLYLFLKEAILPLFINPLGSEDRFRVLRYNHIVGGIQIQQLRRERKPCEKEYPNMGPYGSDGRTNPLLAGFYCFPWYRESDTCFVPEGLQETQAMDKGFCPDSMVYGGKRDRRLQEGASSKNFSSPFVDFHAEVEDEFGVGSDVLDRSLRPEGLGGTGTDYPGARKGAESDGSGKTFTVYVYEHEGLQAAKDKIDFLQQYGWIDHGTAWVGVRMLLLNPDLGMFTHSTISLWLPPSGEAIPDVSSQSFLPEPYQDKSIIALDALWGFTLLCLLFTIFRGMWKAAGDKEGGACRRFWSNPWIWVDVFTALGGVVIIICWLVLLEYMEEVKTNVVEVRIHTPGLNEEVIGYGKMVAKLHESVNRLSAVLSTWRTVLCLYSILIVGQFFEAFSAQPRLAMVTNTIARASIDLFHFFVVWFLTFVAYAVAGMQLFGRRLHSFSEFKLAINTCFLIMLGDFDFNELGAEHADTAALWFFTFMVLISIVIVNMIMAIIMDVYTEVKSDAHDSESLWDQLRAIGMEVLGQLQNTRVSAKDLMRAIEDIPDEQDMQVEDLIHCVTGIGIRHMSYAQARDTIKETKKRVERELAGGMQLSDALNSIGWIKVAVDKTGRKLQEILQEDMEEGDMLREAFGLKGGEEEEEKPTFDFGPHLDQVEARLSNIEHFMNEAMQYTSFRGKDMRNRLCVIEDLLRSQRDAVMANAEQGLGRMDWSSERQGRGAFSTSQPAFYSQNGSQVWSS